jgi:HEAT repeat protein
MRFNHPCPYCGLVVQLNHRHIGKQLRCQACGRIFYPRSYPGAREDRAQAKSEGARALTWAILGMVLFWPVGILGIPLGRAALRKDPSSGAATAAVILGWICATPVILGLAILGFMALVSVADHLLQKRQDWYVRSDADRAAQVRIAEEARQQAAEEARQRAQAEKLAKEAQEREAAKRAAAARRHTTNQQVIQLGTNDPSASVGEWADASQHAVQQGDLRLRVNRVRRKTKHLLIELVLSNVGKHGGINYQRWGTPALLEGPRLFDSTGSSLLLVPLESGGGSRLLIPPNGSVTELFLFEAPVGNLAQLKLELPASAFEGTGQLRIQIPERMLLFANAGTRGSSAVPQLRAVLADKDPQIRADAAAALGDLGSKAADAVTDLGQALGDKEAAVRKTVAQALRRIGPDAKAALPSLLESLTDADGDVRQAALEALDALGPFDRTDVHILVSALRSQGTRQRSFAAKALGRVGLETQSAVHALVEALGDNDTQVRAMAALSLGNAKVDVAETVLALTRLLKDSDQEVRANAIRSLEKLGPAAGSVRGLIEACNDSDKGLADLAATALTKLDRLSKEEVPTLMEALKNKRSDVRVYAATALGRMGREASRAVSTLIGALQDDDADVRHKVAVALGKIGPAAWSAAPDLAKALTDRDATVRQSAVTALEEIGPDAKAAVPGLLAALKDTSIRVQAVAALRKIGKAGVPDLIDALQQRHYQDRLAAIQILSDLGPDAVEAVPALTVRAKSDPYPNVRRAATAALQVIQAKR